MPPLHVFFLVSDYCNLKCEMCNWLTGKEGPLETLPHQLKTEEVKAIVGQLPRQALLTFSGGEALTRADFMEILEVASRRMKCHLITNGTLFNKEKIEKTVALGMKSPLSGGLVMVGFSLQGDREIEDRIAKVPDTFDKVVDAVEALQEEKRRKGSVFPQVHMTTVITAENLPILSKIHSIVKELKVEYHNFALQSNSDKIFTRFDSDRVGLYEPSPSVELLNLELLREQFREIEGMNKKEPMEIRYSPPGITFEEIEKYHQEKTNLADYYCGGLWTKMAISSYGEVYMCYRKLGNLRESPFKKIWNGDSYRELRREIKSEGLLPGCLGCCYREYGG